MIYLDSEVWSALQLCRTRTIERDVLCDVYDGKEYRKHSHFLCHPENISLVMNTDGVAIFKSSKRSLWPIWLTINELPVALR